MTTDPERAPAFAAALDAALADLADVDVVTAPARVFPGVLRHRGFLRDDSFPLARFATTTTHVVRPLPDPTDTSGFDADVFDADAWTLMLADLDVESDGVAKALRFFSLMTRTILDQLLLKTAISDEKMLLKRVSTAPSLRVAFERLRVWYSSLVATSRYLCIDVNSLRLRP